MPHTKHDDTFPNMPHTTWHQLSRHASLPACLTPLTSSNMAAPYNTTWRRPTSLTKTKQVVLSQTCKYPKARYHWLVLPKENISSLKAVSAKQLDLLKHMHKKGQELIDKTEDAKHLSFRLGYHAIPSMSHLHLHVISQDFDSPCLKHKKHWNSFTTNYFIDSSDVMEELEKEGKIADKGSRNERLKDPLRCHVCKKEQVNMPKLKAHILSHIPKPGDKK
ncbi:aprataxin-like [Branchiostoma floridae x Branchiostoma japonicum]